MLALVGVNQLRVNPSGSQALYLKSLSPSPVMNLSTFSYFCFLGFIASSFFSPSLRAVFLVAGLIFWGFSSLRDLAKQSRPSESWTASSYSAPCHDVKILSKLLIVYICVNLVLDLIHGVGILPWLKSLVSTYLQWFWGLSVVCRHCEERQPRSSPAQGIQLTIIASATLLSLIIILQLFAIIPSEHGFYGVLSQPFTSSGLLLISFFTTLISLDVRCWTLDVNPEEFNVYRLTFNLSLIIQLIAIFTLGQRSVWLGLLLAILIYLIARKQYQNKFVWISILILVLAGSFIVNKSPRVGHKIQRFVKPSTWLESKTFTLRKKLWEINYEAWKQKPITGTHKIIEHQGLYHVHNIYLQQLFTGGLVKFIAWFGFYLLAAWFLFQQSLPLFCALTALSVEGLLENWWGDSEVLTLFLVTLILLQAFKQKKSTDRIK